MRCKEVEHSALSRGRSHVEAHQHSWRIATATCVCAARLPLLHVEATLGKASTEPLG